MQAFWFSRNYLGAGLTGVLAATLVPVILATRLEADDATSVVLDEEEAPNTAVVPSPEGECVVETLTARETVALSARASFAIEAEAGGVRQLVWGPERDRKVPLADVVSLRLPGALRHPLAPQTLFLRDGTELRGQVSAEPAASSDEVAFTAPGVGREPLHIALDHVKGLLVNPSLEPRPAAGAASPTGSSRRLAPSTNKALLRLNNEILRSAPSKDVLVLFEGGRSLGILESIGKNGARFSSEGLGDVQVSFEKLRCLILAELEAEKKPHRPDDPALVRAGLRDGSTVVGSLVGFDQGHAVIKTAVLGEKRVEIDHILEISFRGGRLQYLSDLEPARVDERLPTAFTANRFPFQRDASVVEGPLRMGGREYSKGLGVHAYSLLEYDLAGSYQRFQATIGLDESARPTGSVITGTEAAVVFRVKLDGKLLLEKMLTWKDPPEAIDLEVARGKILALEVDCGKADDPRGVFNFALDRSNWANARLLR